VAEYVHKLFKGKNPNTMIYRVHEAPDPERLRIFSTFAGRFGHKVESEGPKVAGSLNRLIEDLEGKPEQDVLQNLAIRTMAKARYSTEVLGHFGLAFEHYSHFTSPIRRYPDMMCHRMLQHYLDGGKSLEAEDWETMAKHSSDMERKAAEAERASIKYKQVEFMQMQDPDSIWEGIVSGVTEFGFYVEIIETKAEGMVRMSDLTDDYYELDAENYRIVGQRNKKIISFGDTVKVRVKEANLARRIIDLEVIL
jgi:ribonuclease R